MTNPKVTASTLTLGQAACTPIKPTAAIEMAILIPVTLFTVNPRVPNAPAQPRRAHVPGELTPHLPPAGGCSGLLCGSLSPAEPAENYLTFERCAEAHEGVTVSVEVSLEFSREFHAELDQALSGRRTRTAQAACYAARSKRSPVRRHQDAARCNTFPTAAPTAKTPATMTRA